MVHPYGGGGEGGAVIMVTKNEDLGVNHQFLTDIMKIVVLEIKILNFRVFYYFTLL